MIASNPGTCSPPAGTPTYTVAAGDVYGPAGLVAAINGANSTPSTNDIIALAANSTYTLDGHSPYLYSSNGNNGLPLITTPITIYGNCAKIQRSSAGGTPNFRQFLVAGNGSLTLEDVTLTNGNSGSTYGGGAIYNFGSLTVHESTLSGNQTGNSGGAIRNQGTLALNQSTVTGNTTTGGGGGIQNTSGALTATDSTISNNNPSGISTTNASGIVLLTNVILTGNSGSLSSGQGGGLYINNSSVTIDGGSIDHNTIRNGGGLFVLSTPTGGRVLIQNGANITDNIASNAGGGLYISGGTVVIDASHVDHNGTDTTTPTLFGGGIWNNGTLTIQNGSTVSDNGSSSINQGGGIRNGGALSILGSTLANNRANVVSGTGAGGAVYTFTTTGNSITDSFITNNAEIQSARNGAGVYVAEGSLTLTNTTISDSYAAANGGGAFVVSGATLTAVNTTFDSNRAGGHGGGLSNGGVINVTLSVFTANKGDVSAGAAHSDNAGSSKINTSCINGNLAPVNTGLESAASSFDGKNNWWGASNGPSGAGPGSGDGVDSHIIYNPFDTDASCPSGRGAPSGGEMMQAPGGQENQVQVPGEDEATPVEPTLTPITLPFTAAFDDEAGWTASGTWALDGFQGHTGNSWTVDTTIRQQTNILEVRAPVDLTTAQHPQLSFWQKGQIASSDQFAVDIRVDGSETWQEVDVQTSVSGDWTQRTVDLSAFAGQTIHLRFRVTTGGDLNEGEVSTGVWVDDVMVAEP